VLVLIFVNIANCGRVQRPTPAELLVTNFMGGGFVAARTDPGPLRPFFSFLLPLEEI